MKLTGDFLLSAVHRPSPNHPQLPSLEILPCAAPAPDVDLGRGRSKQASIFQRRPPVSPSLLAFSTFPDRRTTHHHPRRPSLFSPSRHASRSAPSTPPPPRPPTLDCPSYNFILPRPTVRVARSSTGRSRSPPGRWISSGPKLAGRPAPDIHHITSRFRRSTQQASDELHDNFLTAHAHPAPGTFKSRFWPMTPWSETQDLVLL